jgi:hypothetical protein
MTYVLEEIQTPDPQIRRCMVLHSHRKQLILK